MGGKEKKGPRTKGNVKASSSGRSAELLGNTTGFIGFGSVLPEGSYVPVLNVATTFPSEEEELSIPVEFRLTLRKMTKKDVTTKIKALQEFIDLCSEATQETLKTILVFWPRIYSRLAVDGDRRVREKTASAHSQFSSKLGRNIAPHLKAMMGAWFTSQCDTYPPAALLATNSIKSCFPGSKLTDAVTFCHNEIVDYISDALMKEQDLNEEEKERMFVGGLAGYSLLLHQLDASTLEKEPYISRHADLWRVTSKLYSVVKKDCTMPIKQSWFAMVTCLVQVLPKLAQENASKIFPSVFVFLDDNESTPLPALWEAVLALLNMDKTVIKIPNQLTPKFVKLLRNGCYGSAHRIGPLVPTLFRIIREDGQNKPVLDRQIIEALCNSFKSRAIANSAMEASALSTMLFQSLDFALQSSQDLSYADELFQALVIPLLDYLIKSKISDLVLSVVLRQMTLALHSWFSANEAVAIAFWTRLEELVMSLIQSPHEDDLVVKQTGLVVSTLLNPKFKPEQSGGKAARAVRIRFVDSSEAVQEPPPSVVVPELFQTKLVELSVAICRNSFTCHEANDCQSCFHLLASLMRDDRVSSAFLATETANPVDMISRSLLPMLEHSPDAGTCFLLFIFLDAVDADSRLKLLEDVISNDSTCVALAVTALEKFSHKRTVLEWLSGQQVANLLSSSAEQAIQSEENLTTLWQLLRVALSYKSSAGLLLLPEEHLNGILNAFTNNMEEEKLNVESLSRLIQLFKFCSDAVYRLDSAATWLDSLINLLCSAVHMDPQSVEDLLIVWKHGADFSLDSRGQSAVGIIKHKMLSNPDESLVDRLVQVFQHVASAASDKAKIIRHLLPTLGEWKNLLNEPQAVHLMAKEYLQGNCFHPLPTILTHFRPVQLNSWTGLVKIAFVISSVAVENQLTDQDLLLHCFYAAAAGDLLLGLYSKKLKEPALEGIDRLTEALKTNLGTLFGVCVRSQQTEMCKKATLNAYERHWIWVQVAKKLQSLGDYPKLKDRDQEIAADVTYSELDDDQLNEAAQIANSKLTTSDSLGWAESGQQLATIRFIIAANLKAREDTISSLIQVIEKIQLWQQEFNDQFLFEAEQLKQESSAALNSPWTVVEIIRLLSTVVQLHPQHLTQPLWDFILCSLTSWCSTLEDAWEGLSLGQRSTSPLLLSFTVALCRLVHECSALVVSIGLETKSSSDFPPNFVAEWNDVFAEAAYNSLLPLFVQLSRRCNQVSNNIVADHLLEILSSSVYHVPLKHIQLTIDQLSPLLFAKHPSVQLAVYSLITKLLPGILSSELIEAKIDADDEKAERAPPADLLAVIEKASLSEIDVEVRVGDLYTVEPYSDECTQLLAFYLGWELVLDLCGRSSSELRYQYAAYLSSSSLMARLLSNVFCIIPHATRQKLVDLEQQFSPDVVITLDMIQTLAVRVFSSALQHLPAVVRRWCNNSDKRTATLVESFTSRCVSPSLCSADLQFCTKTWDNMTVRVRPNAREVVATYKLNDEGSMELVIQLPTNYPLGNITVETGRKVGVTSNQWRNWMLQLTTFLMHQNGSILDGLTLWKRNVDKRFEGIEECYICYYVLHGSNYQLPKLSCRTCRKKFHADCLYKWFSSSNNSTCPLCRNLF